MDYSASDVKVYQTASNLLPSGDIGNAVVNNIQQQQLVPAAEPGPSSEPVKFDPDSLYYDMSGVKRMIIFNHSKYEKNYIYGEEPPNPRKKGTFEDVEAVDKLFTSLGFIVKPYKNKRYLEIKKIVQDLCAENHSGTSCVAVVIMTHGFKKGVLCAYDRPYLFSEIIKIFENGHISLVHKPKLFFIQALEVDPSKCQLFDTILLNEHDSSEASEQLEQKGSNFCFPLCGFEFFRKRKLVQCPRCCWNFLRSGMVVDPRRCRRDSRYLSRIAHSQLSCQEGTKVDRSESQLFKNVPLCEHDNSNEQEELNKEACRGDLVDHGKMTYHDGNGKKSLHVPTHVDFLFARSTVEDYRAWREHWGSWFLQELCNVIRMHHKTLDLVQMLTLVTRKVSYKYKSNTLEPELNEKKETPETKFTLTKLLKF